MSYGSGSHRNTALWSRSNTSSSYSSDSQAYQAIGNVSYPISKRTYSDNYGNSYSQSSLSSSNKSKTIRGYVTRMYDTWGLIDNDCHFSFSVCVKGIPKMNDHVLADSVYSPNPQYKWKATRVQILNSDRDFSNIKSLMGSRSQNDFDSRKRGRSPLHRDKGRDQRYDDGDRKRFKRDDKDEKSKDLSERESHRERDKPKEIERSPIRRRSKTPVKRRLVRYAVKVPTELLNLPSADIVTLKKRYPALYIPSDFFTSNFCWTETFPLHKPFTLDKPCAFHIMHKDCDSYEKKDAILDPPDLDYVFSAKVLLMSIPSLDEIYKKSVCLAEEIHKEDDRGYTYLTRLIQFLVGTRGKGDPLAIGGPWSPFLDGENPDKDPSVLIKTAIRTCKALTGIDLSGCSQWYRFMEVYYHRSESVHKGKTIPARIETVVFFLPEVWNCVPTCLEWEDVIINYKKLLEEKLQPKTNEDSASQIHSDQAEESDKEEDLVVIDKCEDKVEPTPYTELDPKNMKVNELRQELEARSLSTKGLKTQLITRLVSALQKEEDEATNTTESNIEADTVVEEENNDIDDLERSEECLVEVDKVEDERIEDEGTDIVEPKIVEPIDRALLEKRYSLPDTPHIIVHPSKSAKSGKFDCTVLSLASLLDYRTNENKEHSFELYMFAELFHEMLQRDFGFSIYKKFCELPEKVKEEKDDKEKKDDKETTKQNTPDKHAISDDKNEKDASNEDSKDEQKSKKDDSEGKKDESEKEKDDTKLNGIKTENGSKPDESKKKEKVKLVTKDPHLLLSFSFFDRTHCGYIFDKDLETIIFSLGLQLSRHQTKKLIAKVAIRDTVHYRKLTDKPEGEEDEENLLPVNVVELTLGNRKFFPIFTDTENVDDTQKTPTSRRTRKGKESVSPVSKCTGLISVGGSVVDVEKVTSSLKKSESSRLEIERQLFKYKKDYDSLKETLKKSSDKERRINEDLQVCRDKLMSANKEKITLMNKSRTYYKLLTSIKDQISAVEEKPEKISKSSKSSDKSDEKTSSRVKKESNDDDTNEKSEPTGHSESTKEGQSKAEPKESSKKTSSSEKTEESTDNAQSDA